MEKRKKPSIAIAFICCYIVIMCWNSPMTFWSWSKYQEGFFWQTPGIKLKCINPRLLTRNLYNWGASTLPKDAFYLFATMCPRGCSALLPPRGTTTAKLHCWWALPLDQHKKGSSLRLTGCRQFILPFGAQHTEYTTFKQNAYSIFAGTYKGLQCIHITEDWSVPERPKGKQ